METTVEIVKGISHQERGAKGARRKKKEEEEEKVAKEERGKQASRRSPFIARLANLEEGRCQWTRLAGH